jgi:hypothetical protein
MNVFFSIGLTLSSTVGVVVFGIALPWVLVAHLDALQAAVRSIGAVLAAVR